MFELHITCTKNIKSLSLAFEDGSVVHSEHSEQSEQSEQSDDARRDLASDISNANSTTSATSVPPRNRSSSRKFRMEDRIKVAPQAQPDVKSRYVENIPDVAELERPVNVASELNNLEI